MIRIELNGKKKNNSKTINQLKEEENVPFATMQLEQAAVNSSHASWGYTTMPSPHTALQFTP
jgi:hypothetical protein